MNGLPFVTVTVPTYNRLDMLEKTLSALLSQTYPADVFEIIVVDDGSSDGTQEFMESFTAKHPDRVRYVRQQNKGPAAARNVGMREGRGEIVAYIDDDCVPEETWLEEITKGYANPDMAGAAGFTKSVDLQSFASRYLSDRRIHQRPFTDEYDAITYPITLNASFRMPALKMVGGFDERFPYPGGEDVDLGLKIRERGLFFGDNSGAVVYHHHKRSIREILRVWYRYGKGRAMYDRKRMKQNLFLFLLFRVRFILFLYPDTIREDYETTSSLLTAIARFLLEKARDTAFIIGEMVGHIEYGHISREVTHSLDSGL